MMFFPSPRLLGVNVSNQITSSRHSTLMLCHPRWHQDCTCWNYWNVLLYHVRMCHVFSQIHLPSLALEFDDSTDRGSKVLAQNGRLDHHARAQWPASDHLGQISLTGLQTLWEWPDTLTANYVWHVLRQWIMFTLFAACEMQHTNNEQITPPWKRWYQSCHSNCHIWTVRTLQH